MGRRLRLPERGKTLRTAPYLIDPGRGSAAVLLGVPARPALAASGPISLPLIVQRAEDDATRTTWKGIFSLAFGSPEQAATCMQNSNAS